MARMPHSVRSVFGWTFTVVVMALLALSAAAALTAAPTSPTADIYRQLGMWELRTLYAGIEIACVLLTLVRRTSLLGIVMTIAYFAGALATVLTHEEYAQAIPVLIGLGLTVLAALLRFPELMCRLKGQKYLALDTRSMVRA